MENMISFSKNELLLFVQKTIVNSGFIINSFEECDEPKSFVKVTIEKGEKKYTLYINVGNIRPAYLPNKPFIKRRQVGKLSLDQIPANTPKSLSMLIGICVIDDYPVFACWNPFYFIGHSTNRSCYVIDSSLSSAISCGVYVGDDCRTPLICFTESHFDEMLDIYLEKSVVD